MIDARVSFALTSLIALLASGAATAQSGDRLADPPAAVYRSEVAAVRFGVEQVCLPVVVAGRPVNEVYRPSFLMRGRTRDPVRSHIQSFVWVDERSGACTVASSRGAASALRDEVMEVLGERATDLVALADSGAGSRDSNGDFRQEAWCVKVDGRQLYLVMSSSSAANRNRIMASFGADRDGGCRSRGG